MTPNKRMVLRGPAPVVACSCERSGLYGRHRKSGKRPNKEQQADAGHDLRKGTTLRSAVAKQAVEPIEMISVTGEDCEDFEFEPIELDDDGDDGAG